MSKRGSGSSVRVGGGMATLKGTEKQVEWASKIRGSSGVFSIYDGSKRIGGASKLSDAKAFVEIWRKKKR